MRMVKGFVRMKVVLILLFTMSVYIVQYKLFSYDMSLPMHRILFTENQTDTVKYFYKSSRAIKQSGDTNDERKYTRISNDNFLPNKKVKGIINEEEVDINRNFNVSSTREIQRDTVKNFYKSPASIKPFGVGNDLRKHTRVDKDYNMPNKNVKGIINEEEMDINRNFNVSKRREMQWDTIKNFYKSPASIKPFGVSNDLRKHTRVNKDYFVPNKNAQGIINEEEMDINRTFNVSKSREMQSDTVKNFYKSSHAFKQFRETNYNKNYARIYNDYFMPNRNVKNINCHEIINENEMDIKRAFNVSKWRYVHRKVSHNDYIEMTKNCTAFIKERGYITHHLTEDEKTFPIAYSMLMYKYVEQAERLLRAIYRPQNLYCIHIDIRTNVGIYQAMTNIANCFDNVFLTGKRIKVKWGEMSVLEPELLCMKELWKRSKTWKYFINLTGQEFPLRTNSELVQILRAYNGSNDVETTLKKNRHRWTRAKTRPPHGVMITKGAVHVAVSRGFVNYILHDPKARDILQWMNNSIKIPDEAYFTTLNHNPHLGVPGSYTGYPETTSMLDSTKPYLARFKNRKRSDLHNWPCHGIWIRDMCIFGIRDLPMLSQRRELFANKFHLEYQPLAYGCLEELIFNRTRDEYLGWLKFDATWYGTLGFVSNKVK